MFFVDFLGWIMKVCYQMVGNFGLAIVLFTLVSKTILLPISIWVQKNSIKMVKMQPEINRLKAKYFGDKDMIAEEESKIYKKYKYNPLASLVPLIAQIVLLLGVVEIVKNPEFYIGLENINYSFFGFDLRWIAAENGGMAIWVPIIAGLSALALCIGQNIMNVLQAEQSKWNKYGMLIFSVALSVYLGTFVTAGVALYWTASNLMAILQQWLLNIFINPKKHVDYKELEKSRSELKELQDLNKTQKRTKEQIKKEKEDYKKFFSVVNKKLVFYSESNGFYKYYKGIIEYILENTNLTIHYITSDYNDNIFELAKTEKKIKPYYIEEKKLITLMMKMEADVVVMTMPDIDNYHIKRSYVDKHTAYVFIPHCIDSQNMTMRKGSMNNYDVVFCCGEHQRAEVEEINKIEKTRNKEIVNWGYSLLDDMINDYRASKKKANKTKTVMIAPSWQKDNIIDLCLDKILKALDGKKYNVIVRPHPQQVRHMKEAFEKMKKKYEGTNIEIQTDFSKTSSVFESDVLIGDWSSIGFEYAFTTEKPVISIDTPMKIMNPDYKKIKVDPINIWGREEIGEVVKLKDVKNIDKVVERMLKNPDKYKDKIRKLRKKSIYNLGKSSEIGAQEIISLVQNKIKERKKK
ncbi:membrane protein insertase YidC [Candidatus Saccharibacteria bacterium]|nr:membrane protein insertase YidC [Candidatus Saccharibacteria bacterium]MBQ6313426.1 membrane protein insertase YidC [Candidatus Saccharibacteria bacterium]